MPQVTLNFDRLNEAGLKPLVKKFEKNGLEVASVDAPNVAKRDSGFQVKTVTFNFTDGQKLLVKVKAGGTIFQVKLNNKVLPFKNVDNMDKAIIELVDRVQDNAKRYAKSKQKRLEQQKIKLEQTPPIRTTRKEQIEKHQGLVAEIQAAIDEVRAEAEAVISTNSAHTSHLDELKAELETLTDKGAELESELKALQAEAT